MKDFRYLLLYLIVVVAGGLIFAFARLYASAEEGAAAAQPAQQPASVAPAAASRAPSLVAAATKSTDQWIADVASSDAGVRVAAITALAEAPRAEALPVLGRILESGDPQADRPQALISLRDLALNQGDDDGAIRDAIRHVIYHGDDFTRAEDAQEALDVIEESLQVQ